MNYSRKFVYPDQIDQIESLLKKKSCQRIIKSVAKNNFKISNKLSIQFEMILYDVHSLFKQRQIHTYYFFSCQTLDIRGNGSSIMFAQYVSNQKLVKLYHTNKILANNFALPLIFFGTYFFYPNYTLIILYLFFQIFKKTKNIIVRELIV